MIKETWKAISGFEGHYEVSDLGRVRSLDRTVVCRGGKTRISLGKILLNQTDRYGRLYVNLSKNNKQKKYYNHILVALTFIGERPENYDVCHIDGDFTNNKLSNIRFDTKGQNSLDMYRYGSKNSMGKLSIEQVLEIRNLYDTGDYTKAVLSRMFKVSATNINNIVTRKSFTWLNDDGTIDESQTAVG